MTMINPLLTPSDAPFGAPRFDLIRKEHYLPAFEESIRRAKSEIDAIANNPEPPSFSNTVEALEYAEMDLAQVEGIFFNLLEADSDPQMEEIAEKVSPMLTEFSLYVSLNRKLFDRIREVHASRPQLERDGQRLLDDTFRSFVRSGAALEEQARERFGQIRERLGLLELKFGQQTLAATNAFSLLLTDEADLEGLPEYVREAGTWYLRVFIDREGGVSIDDCERVSRRLDPLLDEADPIADSYVFEVGSAGAERQLKRPSDFEQFMGSDVEVRLYRPVDGSKHYTGTLTGYEDGAVTLTQGEKTLRFTKEQVAQVRLYVSFN